MGKKALVIGATGLLGYSLTNELSKTGWVVKAVGRERLDSNHLFNEKVEYIEGDIFDEEFLSKILSDIDKVFYFLSTTFPSTSTNSLEMEIGYSLKGLDYLLRKMKDKGVKELVFPSSGGMIYGDISVGTAKEEDMVSPNTPYGVGKLMCEEILRFYSQLGISSTILRIGNVYGSPLIRNKNQGVIDVFIQKALTLEEAVIWGDAINNIRDYIFIDDAVKAIAMISNKPVSGIEIYNLSSGIGVSLGDIISIIDANVQKPLVIRRISENTVSSVKRIVLDINKIKKTTGWSPQYSIQEGIKKTVERKMKIF